jgi:hypothetical protein
MSGPEEPKNERLNEMAAQRAAAGVSAKAQQLDQK